MGLTKVSYAMINGAPFNVLDYGAKGDGSTDDQPAIQAAIDAAVAAGGGTVYIPAGTYKMNDTLVLAELGAASSLNLYIVGDGIRATTLDFNNSPANSDSIAITGWKQYFGMSGFTVKNSQNNGININAVDRGSTAWLSCFYLRDIEVYQSVRSGFRFCQTYVGECDNLISRGTGRAAFELVGFHTSMSFRNCYADQYSKSLVGGPLAGFYVNGCTYSSFITCASDLNAGPGYLIENCAGLTFDACGAESNGQEAFQMITRNDNISDIPSIAHGINALSLNGCFALDNGKTDPTVYPSFFNCLTSDSTPAAFTVSNCRSAASSITNTYGIILNSISGVIGCEINNSDTLYGRPTYKSGQVSLFNRSKTGLVSTAVITAPVAIPNGTSTLLPFTSFFTNEVNATLSAGKIVIPAGINRIRVTVGVGWDTSSTGTRYVSLRYNGLTFYGNGQQKVTSDQFSFETTVSALIDVSTGGEISVFVEQTSGAALNVLGLGISTYAQLEVIG